MVSFLSGKIFYGFQLLSFYYLGISIRSSESEKLNESKSFAEGAMNNFHIKSLSRRVCLVFAPAPAPHKDRTNEKYRTNAHSEESNGLNGVWKFEVFTIENRLLICFVPVKVYMEYWSQINLNYSYGWIKIHFKMWSWNENSDVGDKFMLATLWCWLMLIGG